MVSDFANKPRLSDQFNCNLLWFSEESFSKDNSSEYFIKLNHNYTRARIDEIHYHINVENLQKDDKIDSIQQNQIANIDISLSEPLAFDDFKTNRKTGSFLLIDKSSNETIACGIINKVSEEDNLKSTNSGFFTDLLSLFKKYFIKK